MLLVEGPQLERSERMFLADLLYSLRTAGQMVADTSYRPDPVGWLAGCLATVLDPFVLRFPIPVVPVYVAWLQVWTDPMRSRLVLCEGDDQSPGPLLTELGRSTAASTAQASAELWASGYVQVGEWTEHPGGGLFSLHVRRHLLPDSPPVGAGPGLPAGSPVLPELVWGVLPVGQADDDTAPTIVLSPVPDVEAP